MSDIPQLLNQWIAASNNYDTELYVGFYDRNATIDDLSVGAKFEGVNGITEYFTSYFIAYKTQTTITDLTIKDDQHAYLKVRFDGDFPQGSLEGSFDFTLNNDGTKITYVIADFVA